MLCGKHPHLRDNICAGCLQDLPWTLTCHQNHPQAFSQSLCSLDYLPPIKGLIQRFKHDHQLAAGRLLSACLYQTIEQELRNGMLNLPQVLIPVPLNATRLRSRGFNQAEYIAHYIGKKLGIPVNTDLCSRLGEHEPLQGQTKQQRLAQMQDLFEINSELMKELGTRGVTSIAIIDDVVTTGATAQALSNSLNNAWDAPLYIQLWCVARTPAPETLIEW